MPTYLASARIAFAVESLAHTRGKSALIDFLIVKRTLNLKQQKSVAIAQSEPAFVQACKEIACVFDVDKIDVEAERQFYIALAAEDSHQGFRRGKFISNGTNTTIGGNKWQAVLELSTGKPRRVSLRSGHESRLEDLCLKEDPSASKPNLAELAVWNYRRSDLDALLARHADPGERIARLTAKFIADYDLSQAEIYALFDATALRGITDTDLTPQAAIPSSYIANLSKVHEKPPGLVADGTCSLDLVVALAAKPFVILTGTSGTGKSRATLSLAEQLQTLHAPFCEARIFELVPVGPDWTSPKKLLGYKTPFGPERTRPDKTRTTESYELTDALRIILRACHPLATKIPHFLVFDEMNLSHVERYFAPFLSLMEAANILEDGENASIIDRQSLAIICDLLQLENSDSPEAESAALLVKNDQALRLPPNLFYVGTINVDETTYMFSPKVLDRAHVLEIKAQPPSSYVLGTAAAAATMPIGKANTLLREAIDSREDADSGGSDPSSVLDELTEKAGCDNGTLQRLRDLTIKALDGCFQLLEPCGFEFGYRVVREIFGYLHVWIKAQIYMGATPQAALNTWTDGLDRAVLQKILPKIHGNRLALGDSLKALAAFLDGKGELDTPAAAYSLGPETSVGIAMENRLSLSEGQSFSLSRRKLLEMHHRLAARNHTSFVR